MSDSKSKKLSTKTRFFVLACVPPAGAAVIIRRKKGYISFLHEENAGKLARKLAAKNPGTRYYVTKSVSGSMFPEAPVTTTVTYS